MFCIIREGDAEKSKGKRGVYEEEEGRDMFFKLFDQETKLVKEEIIYISSLLIRF